MCASACGKMKYATVHIPENLAILIDKLIENGEFAYSSRSEFVKDAIRRHLEYHGYHPQSGILIEKSKVTINPSLLNKGNKDVVAEINTKIKMLNEMKELLVKDTK